MDLKRAVWLNVLMYLSSFVTGVVIAIIANVDFDTVSDLPGLVIILGVGIMVVFAVVFTRLYFKDKNLKPSTRQGLYFGLTALVVGFVLDVIMFLPVLLSESNQAEVSLSAIYSDPIFWLTLILLLIVTSLTGQHFEKM